MLKRNDSNRELIEEISFQMKAPEADMCKQ